MATEKQIAANRANALKCTGPRTEKGRATSSMNALKTGLDSKMEIIEGYEDRDERDALTAAWYARFKPANEEECYLLDTAISSEWLQRRYLSVEANLWKAALKSSPSLGVAFDNTSSTFSRVERRLNSAHRNHASAMKQLRALRAKRGADPVGDIPQPEIAATVPVSAPSDPLPSRDCEGAVPEIPNPTTETEPLNPELVSFRTFPDPPPITPAEPTQNAEDDPPIAA